MAESKKYNNVYKYDNNECSGFIAIPHIVYVEYNKHTNKTKISYSNGEIENTNVSCATVNELCNKVEKYYTNQSNNKIEDIEFDHNTEAPKSTSQPVSINSTDSTETKNQLVSTMSIDSTEAPKLISQSLAIDSTNSNGVNNELQHHVNKQALEMEEPQSIYYKN